MMIPAKVRPCRFRWALCAVLALTLSGVAGAGAEAPNVTVEPIVVDSVAALQAALAEENAGRVINLASGSYETDIPLVLPDGVILRGEGVMLGGKHPSEFDPGSITRISAAPGFSGDLVTLGNGAAIHGLQLEQTVGPGNVVMVGSRMSADSIAASIAECEIINPNHSGVGPLGPTGEGIVLTTRNANASGPPAPHEDARIALRMHRSIVRASASGTGIFVINFGARGMITADLVQNTIEGALRVVGGVSRGDSVSGAVVHVHSEQNRYTAPVPAAGNGWQIFGGGSTPIPIPTAPTTFNSVYFNSTDDVVEGFETAIQAEGAHKFFGAPQQAVSNNLVDLRVHGLVLGTADVPGAADFRLYGAKSDGEFAPGNGNVLRMLVRNVTGSGFRDNSYAHTFGPMLDENMGQGNRLVFIGGSRAFRAANDGIDSAPVETFFSFGN